MHTFINRAQSTSGKLTTVLGFAALAIAIISWAQIYVTGGYSLSGSANVVDARMTWRTARRFGSGNGKPKENVRLKFDLDADLSPLFNWNTKQVFAYVTLDYQGPTGRENDISNSVTVWDKIIKSPKDAKLKLRQERSKYSVWDVTDSFEGRQANVTLRWNVQPKVGFLLHGSTAVEEQTTPFDFPTEEAQK